MPQILHNSPFYLQLRHYWHLLTFSLFFSNQCQAEDKQRGVCEPRDPVAAAVPEECYQQVSCKHTRLILVLDLVFSPVCCVSCQP